MPSGKVVRVERGSGQGTLVYSVKPKKDGSLEELAAAVSQEAAPFVANVEAEQWA
jgi:hypothetical protein